MKTKTESVSGKPNPKDDSDVINKSWIAHCAYLESENLKREQTIKEWKGELEKSENEKQKELEIDHAWEENEDETR